MAMPSAPMLIAVLLAGARMVQAQAPDIASSYACCIPLGRQMQFWWSPTPVDGQLDFALVGAVSEDGYMGWGPVFPGAINRFMGGADAVVTGWSDVDPGSPWVSGAASLRSGVSCGEAES
jgi:hypothetical protein